MRTITTAQRNQVAAGTLAIFTRLEVQNPDLVWTDVSTALSTPDWFNEATLTESIDQLSQSFTAVLLRDTGSLSLAPLRTDSTINRNSVPAYAPMLDVKRQWRASIAVVATGTTPASGDWKPVGQGFIDAIDVQGSPSTITVTGRDMLARILDHYMHGVDGVTAFTPYSPSGTDSMETVIQQILDDELGTGRTNVGSSGITLYTPVSPSYVMNPYTTGVGGLMDALTKVAQLAGMVLRYRYDASDVSRLTLLKPPRTATVADWTIGKDEYSVIPVNKLDVTGVRTVIDLFYIDSTLGGSAHVTSPAALTGTLTATAGAATFSTSQAGVIANGALILVNGKKCTVSAFNGTTGCTLSGTPTFAASPWTTSASLTKYGLLYMKVDTQQAGLPMTTANAQAMADAIRSDLETPWLEQQFTSYALWFAQLYDYAKTLANGVQYNADQLGGVTTITHRMKGGTVKTDIGARGQPAGGYRLWLQTGLANPASAFGPNLSVKLTPGTTSDVITWSGDSVQVSIDGAAYGAPAASPITVARNAPGGANKAYSFTGLKDSQTVSNTVVVTAQSGSTAPSASLIPSLTNNQLDDTTTPVTLTASATNLPATYTWAIYQGYSKGQYSATASWSGSNSSNPLTQTESVTPALKWSKWFKLVVTVGSDTYVAESQVQGRLSFITTAGTPDRGYAWNDGGYAAGASDAAGNYLASTVNVSTGVAANRMFAKGLSGNPDTLGSVPDDLSGGFAKTAATYLDANRPSQLYRSTGTGNVSADYLAASVWLNAANLVANGNAEDGVLGGSSGWTFGAGNALLSYGVIKYRGTRSWALDNSAAATDSYSYQDIPVVAGKVYKLEGMIRVDSISGGWGAVLNIGGAAPTFATPGFTILEKVGDDPDSTRPDVGIHTGGSLADAAWHQVACVFLCTVTTTLRFYLELGYSASTQGQAFFDDVSLQEMPPATAQGAVRGYTALDSNARLASQRRNVMTTMGGLISQAFVPTTATPVTNPLSSSSLTITVAAMDIYVGSGSKLAYGGGTVTAEGIGVNYVYLYDPTYTGAGTLYAKWDPRNLVNADGVYYVGKITVVSGSGGTGGGYCVAPETPILMADAADRCPAGDLRVGDMIDTEHDGTFKRGFYAVRAASTHYSERWRLVLADGRELIASPGHRVYVQGRAWLALDKLVAGDLVVGSEPGTVRTCDPHDHGPVVRLTVEGAETYMSNGLLSHNAKAL